MSFSSTSTAAKSITVSNEVDLKDVKEAIRNTVILHSLPEVIIEKLAKKVKKVIFNAGEFIARDGDMISPNAYILTKGKVKRWVDITGSKVPLYAPDQNSVGLLHLFLEKEVNFRFNAECLTEVTALQLNREDFYEALNLPRKGVIDSESEVEKVANFAKLREIEEHLVSSGEQNYLLLKKKASVSDGEREAEIAADLAKMAIIHEFAWIVRNQSCHLVKIPLLQYKAQNKISWTSLAIASAVESFYRSALNNLINQKVMAVSFSATAVGKERSAPALGKFFPDMHVQIPTRIIYISGLKQLRVLVDNIDLGDREIVYTDDKGRIGSKGASGASGTKDVQLGGASGRVIGTNIDTARMNIGGKAKKQELNLGDKGFVYNNAKMIRLFLCFIPGTVMCPMSSILEATNASHCNKEPLLTKRWTRGFAPRLVREIIFAIGINQMTDLCAARFGAPMTDNQSLRGAIGSVSAGIISGYFSHVPHVISTMKLLSPHKSYGQLWTELYMKSLERLRRSYDPHIVISAPSPTANIASDGTIIGVKSTAQPLAKYSKVEILIAKSFALIFPVGVVRRSIQIAGTFFIINGITYSLKDKNWY